MSKDVVITEENGVLTIKCPGNVTLDFKGESDRKLNDLLNEGRLNIVACVNTEEELKKQKE